MIEKIYIETSVIGAYFDDRSDVISAAQQYWSKKWWHEKRSSYNVFFSQAVVDELKHPNYPYSKESLELISESPLLPIENEIKDIVRVYIRSQLMPNNPIGDAIHLAIASYHKCDYLLTWNCKHIANPNKFGQIRVLNNSLGLYVPSLVTPNQLIGD